LKNDRQDLPRETPRSASVFPAVPTSGWLEIALLVAFVIYLVAPAVETAAGDAATLFATKPALSPAMIR
jgi:hypothetical protein